MADVAKHADELGMQLDFMMGRLQEARQKMDGMPLVVAYTDSKGNTRTKANPAFDAYNALMRNYCRTLSEFREVAGSGSASASVLKFEKFAKTMRKAADA